MTVADSTSGPGQSCSELQRFRSIDQVHTELREDVKEIREGFMSLSNEIHEIVGDLREFTAQVQGVLQRLDDRDKRAQEIAESIKETFNRFDTKIERQEIRTERVDERVRELEKLPAQLQFIEKTLWGVAAGTGALILYYLQLRIH